jgi:beta-lactamase class A
MCLLVAVGGVHDAAAAQEPLRDVLTADFRQRLETIVEDADGVVGVHVIDVTSGIAFGVNDDLVFPQGSSIKVPVLLTLYAEEEAGRLRTNDRLRIQATDREGGSGFLRYFSDGASEVALHDLAVFMIVVSDNMATNLLVDRVGLDRINAFLDDAGFRETRMRRKMMRTEESARNNENTSSPAEAAELMRRIGRCELPVTRERCDEIREILTVRHPHPSPFQDEATPGVVVAEKNGWFTGVRTTWAFVDLPGRPFAAAVMGTYSESDILLDTARRVAAECYRYFGRLAGATDFGTRVPLDMLRRSGPPGG